MEYEPKLVRRFHKEYYICPYCYTIQTKIIILRGHTRYYCKFKEWWNIKTESYKSSHCFACGGEILFPPILWETKEDQ